MKNISIKSNLSTVSTNNYFPIVIFGNNLLQAGYDVINDLILSGGGGTITLTKESINAVDSTITESINSVNNNKNATFNSYVSDTLTGKTAKVLYTDAGNSITSKSSLTSIEATKKEVYPFLPEGENTGRFLDSTREPQQVPTLRLNAALPNIDREVLSEVSVKSEGGYLSSQNIVQLDGFLRDNPIVTKVKQAIETIGVDVKQVVSSVNTTVKEVVTDATISGAVASPYSDSIVYNYDGTEVTISGNGYKRLLSETSNKPIKVNLLRVQIIGATDSQIDDILSQKGYVVNVQGNDLMEYDFYPTEFVNPNDYQKNILDIPLEVDYDGNTAIVLGGIQNSDVEIKCTFFYN